MSDMNSLNTKPLGPYKECCVKFFQTIEFGSCPKCTRNGSGLTYLQFFSSEGGRKCVKCCKYRKHEELKLVTDWNGHLRIGTAIVEVIRMPICVYCLEENL